MLTGKHRRAARIKYPIAYATAEQAEKDPKAFAFNCGMCGSFPVSMEAEELTCDGGRKRIAAQRAHANFTEHLTPLLGSLLIAGLKSPVYAAGLGVTWSVARVFYALGYTKKGPEGRQA